MLTPPVCLCMLQEECRMAKTGPLAAVSYNLVDLAVFETLLSNVAQLTWEHIILVTVSCGIAVVLGIGLAIVGTRKPHFRRVSIAVANVLQTIPSLALFGFLLPVPLIGGIGRHTAILSLVLYSLLPILRNTIVGITTISAPVREAAIAMGMTNLQLLRLVELPLAAPAILAGIRIALVTNIGTAVIAAVIGGGGLGVLIFSGIASVNTLEILAGAIPAALLALLSDWGMSLLERKVAVA
jgi:osmoprotectant transport system permease protein